MTMKKITAQEQKKVYMDVINILVKEKDKWEFRVKHPLPRGWLYGEDHPRIGELIHLFPNMFKLK